MTTPMKRHSARWLFLAVALPLLCGGPAQAASVNGIVDCASGACFIKGMKLAGVIDAATPDKVAALVAQLHKAADGSGKSVHPFSVELDSPGGSVSAAFAMGRMVRYLPDVRRAGRHQLEEMSFACSVSRPASNPMSGRLRNCAGCPRSRQFLQQRLCLFQIARVEAFSEPAVHRSEKLACFLALTLVTPEACEAHGGAQLK
jgi:hypothetical protein